MHIVVTGSLGHIGRPLTEMLVKKGHTVTVVSSKEERKQQIEELGASAAIGLLEDPEFLKKTFTGSDVVYFMTPPNQFAQSDYRAYCRQVAEYVADAVRQTGVSRVIHLSSYGADLEEGTGLIMGRHDAEMILNELTDVAVTHMRPTYFYYNLYSLVPVIKNTGMIMANYGGDDHIALVAPEDIAVAIVDEVEGSAWGQKVRYVNSDECTGHEIARVLGNAIGKPDLRWVVITDEQMQQGLEAGGVPTPIAKDLVEMFSCLHSGKLAEDYYEKKPIVMGKVKLTDFAREFAKFNYEF